ncbi:MAG: hypothetical protein HKN92_11130, partial [Chitinophagales bacterium]|nr:hypothetical protein [Chitinophagales bacterium]
WSVLNTPFQNEQADDSWRLSLGGRVTPELNPREKNYFKRMDYGLGLYTGLSELIVEDEQFREYGITFGVGLPVASAKTFIALDIGSRSNGAENLFRETSYKLSASFTLSDNNWFIKRKFD